MADNLRHDDLEPYFNEDTLETDSGHAYWARLRFLHQLAEAREKARGKYDPTRPPQVDYNFYVENDVVSVVRRKRGAPLDKIVAELMIFANSTWGKLMHDHGVPGIYRSQGRGVGGWNAKMQVRMLTHAAPHEGLGVDQYAWSTSPLRRYTDLVNQWQILAVAEKGVMAPLVAPFKHKDANLFAIVSAFDAAYAAYADFQANMERYWCLRWLGQEDKHQVEAVVLKDEVLRLTDIPLVIRLPGMPSAPRGAAVKLDVIRDRGVMARLGEDGQVQNLYRVQLTNRTERIARYRLDVDGLPGIEVAPHRGRHYRRYGCSGMSAGRSCGRTGVSSEWPVSCSSSRGIRIASIPSRTRGSAVRW